MLAAELREFAGALTRACVTSLQFGEGWLLSYLPAPSANARILISRNKREGGYCGRMRGSWRPDYSGSRHRRAGLGEIRRATLRDWAGEWK